MVLKLTIIVDLWVSGPDPHVSAQPAARSLWYRRCQAEGINGLRTRSKRPKTGPNATHVEVAG
ncbi:hypothetical protein [Nonomuraea sp. NPDC003201]